MQNIQWFECSSNGTIKSRTGILAMAKALRRTSASRTGCANQFSEQAALELAAMLGYQKPAGAQSPELEHRVAELELERLVTELERLVEKESE